MVTAPLVGVQNSAYRFTWPIPMVMDNIEKFPIQRVTREGKQDTQDIVTTELPLTVILNNRELVTLLCSPTDLEYLAIGFLAAEGLIKSKDEVKKIAVNDRQSAVYVETEGEQEPPTGLPTRRFVRSSSSGVSFSSAVDTRGLTKVKSRTVISVPEIFNLVKEFQHRSQIYRATGGVHGAALCDTSSILLFSEDIGRHNAIDKILGECIWKDISANDRIMITSGRISSEILLKVARQGIPILISKSAPTNLGVKLANDWDITVIGFVRGERMNIYSGGWRVNNF